MLCGQDQPVQMNSVQVEDTPVVLANQGVIPPVVTEKGKYLPQNRAVIHRQVVTETLDQDISLRHRRKTDARHDDDSYGRR